MDQFLQSLDNQLTHEDRGTAFGRAWTAGMGALSEAQEYEGAERQARLVESCDCFIEAIRFGPDRPEPYLGMAYLLTLLEDYHSAGKYVRLALKLAPEYPEALDLERLIQTCSVVSDAIADLSELCMIAGVRMEEINPDAEDLDLDELLHKTETLLYTQIKLLEYEELPQVQTRPEKIAEMSHKQQELQAFVQGIRKRLNLLHDRAFDISELEVYLAHVEDLSQKYSFCLKVSRHLLEMGEWVRQDFKQMTRHVIKLRMNASAEEIARAEQFDAEMLKRYSQIEVAIEELDSQTREQFEEAINFQHLKQQREHFQQLLDATRRRILMPNS